MAISKSQKAINAAVTAYLNGSATLDVTAQVMLTHNVLFNAIESTIHNTGVKLGLILTDEQVEKLVSDHMAKEAKPVHFLDVVTLANKIDSNQLPESEKYELVQKFFKTNLVVPAKFKQFAKTKTAHGKIASYILNNPNFVHGDLYQLDMGDTKNKELYFDEFLAYQSFFEKVEALKAAQ